MKKPRYYMVTKIVKATSLGDALKKEKKQAPKDIYEVVPKKKTGIGFRTDAVGDDFEPPLEEDEDMDI